MSRRYVLSAHAQDDRDGIFEYTAKRSGDVEVAVRVDKKIETTLDDIAANPKIGHSRADLGIPERLLVRGVYSYLVIYNPKTRPVQILRIWHGAQEKPEIPET
jgi:plasmid stabilization system protein ParE